MAHVRPPDPRDRESRSGQDPSRMLVKHASALPTRKVGAGALAGAITVIGVYVAEQFGADIPPEVASSITTVLSVATGYIVKDRA